MHASEIIRKKRDGGVISKEEFRFLVNGNLAGDIPDYQITAFLMASFLNGMNRDETIALTDVMLHSGEVLDLSEMENPVVDKHSTGGVGDKTSIILAPLLASADLVIPMISGRALGHTGGTLDKLESIPGFRTDLSIIEFRNILWETGVAMTGQTDEIAPADRKLYALRDTTATVESIPLIVSSILSKKLAEGINGLVLDVKTGSGAFMKSLEEAEELARIMVDIGNSMGVRTVALITDMDEPLGKTIGNSLEVRECINFLKGNTDKDLYEVTLTLGAWMLYIGEELISRTGEGGFSAQGAADPDQGIIEAKKMKLKGLINSGKALEKFMELVKFQGGNPEIIANPGLLPVAEKIKPVKASSEGYIRRIDAEKIGVASMLLGAGRERAEDGIDHSAGIILQKKSGTYVQKDEVVAVLHYNDESNHSRAYGLILDAFEISSERPAPRELIKKIVL
jgi:pyrimidine-nucleoside phosphorylase